MKNLKYLMLILLLGVFSCNDDLKEQGKDQNEHPVLSSVTNGAGPYCFDYNDYLFERGEFITARAVNNKAFFEYSLKPNDRLPLFVQQSQVSEEVTTINKLVEVYDNQGQKEEYFRVISGLDSEIGDSIGYVTVNYMPSTFTGQIIVYKVSDNSFVEAKTYVNGNRTGLFTEKAGQACNTSSPANGLGGEDIENRNDDCIDIYYWVPTLNHAVRATDWYNTSGESFDFIGTSYSYETFPSVFLETFTFCPDNDNTQYIPEGDDGGIDQFWINQRRCLDLAQHLMDNGFHDPCNPGDFPGEVISEALGGWGNCLSEEELIDKINDYLGDGDEGDIEFTVEELEELANLPDEIACIIANNRPEDIQAALSENDEAFSIFPISCQSFSFDDFGLFQVSQLEGTKLSWWDSGNPATGNPAALLECDFDIQVTIPVDFYHNGSGYDIPSGMASNIAADAINLAKAATLFAVGQQGNFNDQDCETVTEIFLNLLNVEIDLAIVNQINDYYGISANIVESDPGGEAALEFDETLGLTPTNSIADLTIFGFLKDNCID